MTRATAAPARWPYMEHRTCEQVDRVNAEVDQMFARAAMLNITDGAKHLSIPRVDNSTCFRCGARSGACEHSSLHRPIPPRLAGGPAPFDFAIGGAGSLSEWLA